VLGEKGWFKRNVDSRKIGKRAQEGYALAGERKRSRIIEGKTWKSEEKTKGGKYKRRGVPMKTTRGAGRGRGLRGGLKKIEKKGKKKNGESRPDEIEKGVKKKFSQTRNQ